MSVEVRISEYLYKKLFLQNDKINYLKLRLSDESIYSIAKPYIGKKICKIIYKFIKSQNITITDAFSNVGGMTILFAKYFKSVNAFELNKLHCDMLLNNLNVYDYSHKVKIYCNDYLEYASKVKQDVIFFDPPWGGPCYKEQSIMSLYVNKINICIIINKLLYNAKYLVLQAPFNYNKNDLKIIKSTYKITKLTDLKNNLYYIIIINGKDI